MEIFFYHLERRPLDAVLPGLLEKTLERNLRAVVKVGSEDRLKFLDETLWSYRDDSFLPHGSAADGKSEHQPILLTLDDGRPNHGGYLFLVDGAAPPADFSGLERILLLLDGTDPDAVDAARAHWKTLKGQGHALSYWQQNDNGRWENKASG